MQLNLYKGILPNYKDNTHYIYKDVQQYFKALEGSLIKYVTADNYRINTNILKMSLATFNNYNELTYIIEVVDAKNIRCYYVKNFYVQSDNIYFELQFDLWGSYIYNAQFNKIVASRCNRRIGNGFFDLPQIDGTIDYFDQYKIMSLGVNGTIPLAELSVVIACDHLVFSNSMTDEKITSMSLIAINAKLFYDAYIAEGTGLNNISALELISRYLGGMYAIKGKDAQGQDADLKLTITKAFLIPTEYIELSGRGYIIKTKTNFIAPYEVKSNEFEARSIAYGNRIFGMETANIENGVQYIGAPFNGLEIKCSASNEKDGALQSNKIAIQCESDGDGLHLYIRCGGEMKDITTSFVLPVLNNSKINTQQEQTNFWLKEISSAIKGISGIASSLMKHDYLGGGTQAVTGALDSIVAHNKPQDPQHGQATSGGALVTYNFNGEWTLNDFVDYPFVSTIYYSPYDVDKINSLKGANFMQPLDNLNLNAYEYLNDNEAYRLTNDTFIVCTCAVFGIPLDAQNQIKGELQSGVYYQYLG